MKNHFITKLALVAIVLMVSACKDNTFQPPPPPTVTVSPPIQHDVTEYIEFTGTTEAFKIVQVRAQVQGELSQILYPEGQEVPANAPLFQIEPELFVATRDAAKSKVDSAEAQAKLADTTAKKMERSAKDQAISEIQALEARAQADVAAAQLEAAKKDLVIKQIDVDNAAIKAPIAGRIAKSNFKVGSIVGEIGSEELTTIFDDSKIYAWFVIPDKIFLKAKQGKGPDAENVFPEVELATEVDAGFPYRGQVDYGDPSVDAETGTLRVRAIFENKDRALVGGLFVRCRIAIGTFENALLVPETSIGIDQAGRFVYVVDDEGIVERRNVVLGAKDGDQRVITEGLEATDKVIVRGLLRARSGSKVNAQESGL